MLGCKTDSELFSYRISGPSSAEFWFVAPESSASISNVLLYLARQTVDFFMEDTAKTLGDDLIMSVIFLEQLTKENIFFWEGPAQAALWLDCFEPVPGNWCLENASLSPARLMEVFGGPSSGSASETEPISRSFEPRPVSVSLHRSWRKNSINICYNTSGQQMTCLKRSEVLTGNCWSNVIETDFIDTGLKHSNEWAFQNCQQEFFLL